MQGSKKYFFLWSSYYDDNWEKWEWNVVGRMARRGLTGSAAASNLLFAYWSYDKSIGYLDQFHWVNECGLLSVAEIMAVANAVWQS